MLEVGQKAWLVFAGSSTFKNFFSLDKKQSFF
jgi:hypothetical protein